MQIDTTYYIQTVTVYAKAKGLDFVTAASQFNELNNATFQTLFGLTNKNNYLRRQAIQILAEETYNRIRKQTNNGHSNHNEKKPTHFIKKGRNSSI